MRLALSTAALLASTSLAFADGGQATPSAPPVYVAPAITDWSGAYGGLSFGAISGTSDSTTPTGTVFSFDWDDRTGLGLFAGYNWQNDALVYGVEVAVTIPADDMMLVGAATPDDFMNSVIDLQGRVGYAAANALIYVGAGASFANITNNGVDYTFEPGIAASVGVDFQLSDSTFVGLNYTTRMFDYDVTDPTNPFQFETTINTISLRLAYRF